MYQAEKVMPSFSVCFGLDVIVEFPFMSTAIVSQFTPEGFAIAADGLRTKTNPTRDTVSNKVQKIFPIVMGDTTLAYAFSGAVEVPDENEKIAFSFTKECERAAKIVGSGTLPSSFDVYVKTVAGLVNERIAEARALGSLSKYPSCADPPGLMAKATFLGFYRGLASRAEIEFLQNDQVLADPVLGGLQTAQDDLKDEDFKKFKIFSGSEIVSNRLFHTTEPDLANYRTSSISNNDLLRRQLPRTLEEATQLVESYIQACIDNRQLDRETCDFIGGHIHVAKLTKAKGFEWVKAPVNQTPRSQ